MRPYIGGEEFINGGGRWILALQKAHPSDLRTMGEVRARVEKVRKLRSDSASAPTRKLAETPILYHVNVLPDRPFLALPKVSSERRNYLPIGWLEPPTIPSDLLFVLLSDDRWHFGVLTSRMHMGWLMHIGGRLESRYRYSVGVVYNTFPWPEASDAAKGRIRALAQAVLDARLAHTGATLGDLYDPDAMPPDLRRAHRALDQAVDRLYRPSGFSDDRERVEHLFGLYESLIARLPTAAPAARKKGTRARRLSVS